MSGETKRVTREMPSEHAASVFARHEIVPFLRSMLRSGEALHMADIDGIEAALALPVPSDDTAGDTYDAATAANAHWRDMYLQLLASWTALCDMAGVEGDSSVDEVRAALARSTSPEIVEPWTCVACGAPVPGR